MKNRFNRSAVGGIIIALIIVVVIVAIVAAIVVLPGLSSVASARACHVSFSVSTATHIGQYYDSLGVYQHQPSAGMKYAIYTITVNNQADRSLSTNAYFWESVISGVSYQNDVATYDSSIGYQNVDVGKGGTFTTKIVYQVPVDSASYSIRYTGYNAPNIVWD
jgi:type II secretory pathway pseudopilin PulG